VQRTRPLFFFGKVEESPFHQCMDISQLGSGAAAFDLDELDAALDEADEKKKKKKEKKKKEQEAEDELKGGGGTLVHIRVQQRNGRKCITTIQGLDTQLDLKKILKAIKKAECCNGTVVEDEEMGQVLQFQGDQRDAVSKFLTENEIVETAKIKKHGAG